MKYIYGTMVALILALLTGCSDKDDPAVVVTEPDSRQLILSAGIESETTTTRAGNTNFPNDGVIVVTAAEYAGAGTTDWTSYADIQNARAETDQRLSSGATYTFDWDADHYWPFDDSQLVFIAYSPETGTNSGVERIDNTHLKLTLKENMPDVMYASNNATASATPYSKSDQVAVDLGQFRHALSQVSVRVKADASMNPGVRLTDVQIKTTRPFATLDLLAGDTGLTVSNDQQEFVCNLLSGGNVDFRTTDYTDLDLFYPGTEGVTSLIITLKDGPVTVEKEFPVSQFLIGNTQTSVAFRRAERAELVVTVVGVDVIHPDEQVSLQGLLLPWVDRGAYRIVIN